MSLTGNTPRGLHRSAGLRCGQEDQGQEAARPGRYPRAADARDRACRRRPGSRRRRAPIPLAALGAAGQALGVEAPQAAITRLIGLGLFDDWGEIDRNAHAAANPLARPLARALDPADSRAVAMGQIDDILQSRGDLDEALRIRREEELPVFARQTSSPAS